MHWTVQLWHNVQLFRSDPATLRLNGEPLLKLLLTGCIDEGQSLYCLNNKIWNCLDGSAFLRGDGYIFVAVVSHKSQLVPFILNCKCFL